MREGPLKPGEAIGLTARGAEDIARAQELIELNRLRKKIGLPKVEVGDMFRDGEWGEAHNYFRRQLVALGGTLKKAGDYHGIHFAADDLTRDEKDDILENCAKISQMTENPEYENLATEIVKLFSEIHKMDKSDMDEVQAKIDERDKLIEKLNNMMENTSILDKKTDLMPDILEKGKREVVPFILDPRFEPGGKPKIKFEIYAEIPPVSKKKVEHWGRLSNSVSFRLTFLPKDENSVIITLKSADLKCNRPSKHVEFYTPSFKVPGGFKSIIVQMQISRWYNLYKKFDFEELIQKGVIKVEPALLPDEEKLNKISGDTLYSFFLNFSVTAREDITKFLNKIGPKAGKSNSKGEYRSPVLKSFLKESRGIALCLLGSKIKPLYEMLIKLSYEERYDEHRLSVISGNWETD